VARQRFVPYWFLFDLSRQCEQDELQYFFLRNFNMPYFGKKLAIQEDLAVILQSHAEMERRLLNYSGYISALLSLFLGNMN
jgi:hypothetical protein